MESRGYIKWEKNPDEVYRVRVLRKDANNNFIELEQVETKNAHLSIRNYLEATSTYYVVEAINTATSMQVGVSDTIPILVVAGHNPWVETCRYRCNGKTYAYQLGLYQQDWNPATNTWSITDPAKLIAKGTYDYFNAAQGITIPFYQAIDAVVWNQISSQHPYKVVYGGNPKYKKITILNGSAGTIGGPFWDAQNNPVFNGVLVEKKMDQYDHFNGDQTTVFNPPSTICDNSLTSWHTQFNNLYDFQNNGQFPNNVLPFANQVPSQLTCNGVTSPGMGGDAGGGTLGGTPWFDIVDDFVDCFNSTENINDLVNCLEEVDNVYGLIFTPVVGVGSDVVFVYNSVSHKLELESQTLDLDDLASGLYSITSFVDSGRVFKTVYEHINLNDTREDKEYVRMSIAPNPIENENLSATFNSGKTMNVRVKVFTLNNEIIADEVINLVKDVEYVYQQSITGFNTPYNQIRVQLIFEDESSTIQQTGIR